MSTPLLYLSEADTAQACAALDVVGIVREALVAHQRGDTQQPAEIAMRWTTPDGDAARSLCMSAAIGEPPRAIGTKIINGNPANVRRGLPRANGLTALADPDTGHVLCLMASARISALRTAAVTAVSLEALCATAPTTLAVIGAGVLSRAHLEILCTRFPSLCELRITDIAPGRAQALADWARDASLNPEATVVDSAEEAIRGADVVVPVTTTRAGYIQLGWLAPGCTIVNVSLDDVNSEVYRANSQIFVDDWELVAADDQRLLGWLYRHGFVAAPPGRGTNGATDGQPAHMVDAELGAVLTGEHSGRKSDDGIVVVNPFGMACEDVALAAAVHAHASEARLGSWLQR